MGCLNWVGLLKYDYEEYLESVERAQESMWRRQGSGRVRGYRVLFWAPYSFIHAFGLVKIDLIGA